MQGTHLFRLYISEPPGWYTTIHMWSIMLCALQGSVQPVHGFSRWDNLAASEVGRSENPLKDLQASRWSYFFWAGFIFAAGEIRCNFEVNFLTQLSLCHLKWWDGNTEIRRLNPLFIFESSFNGRLISPWKPQDVCPKFYPFYPLAFLIITIFT